MAYVKHGTGPNDHKKGNRTRGKDRRGNTAGRPGVTPVNIDTLVKANETRHETIEYYKELARNYNPGNTYTLDKLSGVFNRIAQYLQDHENTGAPITQAGCLLAGDISADTWQRMGDGELDHLLYMYMDKYDIPYDLEGTEIPDPVTGEMVLLLRPSAVQNRIVLHLQDQRERLCSTNKGNPAGSIFLLKAMHGLRDDPDRAPATTNQTLIIADREQAEKALQLLAPGV